MLARHMAGYAPSLIIPGLLSFVSVFCFTRLLEPTGYGHYVLAINAMTMLLGVGFFWLQSAASRLLPQAIAQGNESKFTATLYTLYMLCSLGLIAVAAAIIALFPLGDWRVAAWFAPPLAIMRALLNLNQAYHRNTVRIARYNIIEIGQAVIGLVVAIALIVLLHKGASGVALGIMLGLVAMVLFDWRMLAAVRWGQFDRGMLSEIVTFGLPFIINYGLSFILSRSDSFLIQIFCGAADVGIYNAGYAFPDRIGQYLFMAVATASLPLTIRRLEKEGVSGARDQTYTNGIAVLALAVPACIGLWFANRQVVTLLIGEDFRAGAMQIMPWITGAMILNGLAAHYFDHAFHLAKKTRLFFYTLGPAALLNFIGNIVLIPRYGFIAAAWTTVASYALYLMLSILVGRRVFRVRFPFKPAFDIILAAGFMALILATFSFPNTFLGLAALVGVGAIAYGTGLVVLNVMGIRGIIADRIRARGSVAVSGDLHFVILTKPAQVEAIAAEWQALYQQSGRGIFGSSDWHQIWWRILGQTADVQLHIVTARTASGILQAVMPLVIHRTAVLRVAEWAGYEVFDYGDILAVDQNTANALWAFTHAHGGYDIALLKDVRAEALSLPMLASGMRLRQQKKHFFLTLDFASGEAWLAAQSRKLRGDVRRKTDKMQARGTVAVHFYRTGDVVPTAVLDALYEQKKIWFAQRKAKGVFTRPEVKPFLHALAQDAARQGTLYLAWVTCGDAIVACHMGFVRGDTLYLYHTTYDADYGAFSPGNLLMIETIKWAIDARLRELDFMRGEESYKARFASDQRVFSTYVAGRSWLGKVLALLQPTKAVSADEAVEENAD